MCRLLIIYDLLIHIYLCTPDANGLFLWGLMNLRALSLSPSPRPRPDPEWFVCPRWCQGHLMWSVCLYISSASNFHVIFLSFVRSRTITRWLFIIGWLNWGHQGGRAGIEQHFRLIEAIANSSWKMIPPKSNPFNRFSFRFSMECILKAHLYIHHLACQLQTRFIFSNRQRATFEKPI